MTTRLLPYTPLELERSDATSTRAMHGQEYLFYATQTSPHHPTARQVFVARFQGTVDRDALVRTARTLVERHHTFRLDFREVGGELHQVVLGDGEAPAFNLEFRDCSRLAEDAQQAALVQNVDEIWPTRIEPGEAIWGRLVSFGATDHCLVLIILRSAFDCRTRDQLLEELASLYRAAASGSPFPEPPCQLVDYTLAVERWGNTDVGKQHGAYWDDELRDAEPVEVVTDFPRAEIDALRDAGPLGIFAADTTPFKYSDLPAPAKQSADRLAATVGVTPRQVYFNAWAWLIHQQTGQRTIHIEDGYVPWENQLTSLFGAVETWTLMKFEFPAGATFGDLLRASAVRDQNCRNGYIQNYYQRVPHTLRRVTFQAYGDAPLIEAVQIDPDLRVSWKPFLRVPVPAKPWDIHLSVRAMTPELVKFSIMGLVRLYRPDTIEAMQRRYADLVASAELDSPLSR